MSTRPVVGPLSAAAHRRPCAGVLALILLVLQASCATGRTATGTVTPEAQSVRVTLPTDFRPVEVGEAELASAVAGLVLDMPLRVASAPGPGSAHRSVVQVSGQLPSESWQAVLSRDYSHLCERRTTPGDCLELFENGPQWEDGDKVRLALSLAVLPAREALDEELRGMLSTEQVWMTVGISLSSYIALLFLPEPSSKVVALGFGLLLWGYLGWELVELGRAYLRLREDAARAHTWEELREAGARFGQAMGPRSLRILLMVGTVTLGSTAALMARVSKLPGYAVVVSRARAQGIHLEAALPVAAQAQVNVMQGSFTVVLPANALAMAARGRGTGSADENGRVTQHHIATVENSKATWNGGPWTPRFKELFGKGGLSMEDMTNKVPLQGHKGPHPEAYHREVFSRLEGATQHCGTDTQRCRQALLDELTKMAGELRKENSNLRKLLDGIPLTE